MSVVRAYNGFDVNTFDLSDLLYGDKYTYSGSSAKVTYSNGSYDLFTGSNFKYVTVEGVKVPSSGTISNYTYYENGSTQFTMTGLSFSVASLMNYINDDDTYGIFEDVLSGKDTVYGSTSGDYLTAFAGNDRIIGGKGDDTLEGEGGADSLYGDAGSDTLIGGSGADYLSGGKEGDRLVGGGGDDELFGSSGNDVLLGGSGRDSVNGGSGNDNVQGGSSQDRVTGGSGTDTLYGGSGDDFLVGNRDNDTLYGESGSDTLYGGSGSDKFFGGSKDDSLYGDGGNDTLYGEEDDDLIYGNRGNDILSGGEGSNYLKGGSGTDTADYSDATSAITANLNSGTSTGYATDTLLEIENLTGSAYADRLVGNDKDNSLTGNAGNDTLIGNDGDDTLDGGNGTDTAIFYGDSSDYTVAVNGSTTTVTHDASGDVNTLTNIETIQYSAGSGISSSLAAAISAVDAVVASNDLPEIDLDGLFDSLGLGGPAERADSIGLHTSGNETSLSVSQSGEDVFNVTFKGVSMDDHPQGSLTVDELSAMGIQVGDES